MPANWDWDVEVENWNIKNAGVAQLVERQPSKLNVAGSNPVSRSKNFLDIENLVQIEQFKVL